MESYVRFILWFFSDPFRSMFPAMVIASALIAWKSRTQVRTEKKIDETEIAPDIPTAEAFIDEEPKALEIAAVEMPKENGHSDEGPDLNKMFNAALAQAISSGNVSFKLMPMKVLMERGKPKIDIPEGGQLGELTFGTPSPQSILTEKPELPIEETSEENGS